MGNTGELRSYDCWRIIMGSSWARRSGLAKAGSGGRQIQPYRLVPSHSKFLTSMMRG